MQALPPARPHPLSPPASAAKKARSSLPWRSSPSVCSPTCLSHVCLFILFEAEEEDEEEMEKMQNGKDRGKRMDYGFQVILLSLISSPLGEESSLLPPCRVPGEDFGCRHRRAAAAAVTPPADTQQVRLPAPSPPPFCTIAPSTSAMARGDVPASISAVCVQLQRMFFFSKGHAQILETCKRRRRSCFEGCEEIQFG